jgi:hypothetical protein
MIGDKVRGQVTEIPDPVWKGYVQVTVPGKGWPRGIHNLVYGSQIPQGIKVGDEVELEYVRYGGGALWFARKLTTEE